MSLQGHCCLYRRAGRRGRWVGRNSSVGDWRKDQWPARAMRHPELEKKEFPVSGVSLLRSEKSGIQDVSRSREEPTPTRRGQVETAILLLSSKSCKIWPGADHHANGANGGFGGILPLRSDHWSAVSSYSTAKIRTSAQWSKLHGLGLTAQAATSATTVSRAACPIAVMQRARARRGPGNRRPGCVYSCCQAAADLLKRPGVDAFA